MYHARTHMLYTIGGLQRRALAARHFYDTQRCHDGKGLTIISQIRYAQTVHCVLDAIYVYICMYIDAIYVYIYVYRRHACICIHIYVCMYIDAMYAYIYIDAIYLYQESCELDPLLREHIL